MNLKQVLKKIIHIVDRIINRYEYREAKKITEYKTPIYHIHIRKTGGTTINFAFLQNQVTKDVKEFYEDLSDKKNHRLIKNDKVFVGWNTNIINEEKFSYAFSHTPLHQLNLSNRVFLFTCLRDPVKRVISHYNMLMWYKKSEKINHPVMKTEGQWLGDCFDEFLNNIPKKHLLNQLYMFSKEYNVEEASQNILNLNYVLFTENLEGGLASLGKVVNWDLPISNQKNYGHKEEISDEKKQKLHNLLSKEYELLDKVKKEVV